MGQLAERRVTHPTQSLLSFVTFVAHKVNLGPIGTTIYFSPILKHIVLMIMVPVFFPLGTFGTHLATYILEPLALPGTLYFCGVCGLCGHCGLALQDSLGWHHWNIWHILSFYTSFAYTSLISMHYRWSLVLPPPITTGAYISIFWSHCVVPALFNVRWGFFRTLRTCAL